MVLETYPATVAARNILTLTLFSLSYLSILPPLKLTPSKGGSPWNRTRNPSQTNLLNPPIPSHACDTAPTAIPYVYRHCIDDVVGLGPIFTFPTDTVRYSGVKVKVKDKIRHFSQIGILCAMSIFFDGHWRTISVHYYYYYYTHSSIDIDKISLF